MGAREKDTCSWIRFESRTQVLGKVAIQNYKDLPDKIYGNLAQ